MGEFRDLISRREILKRGAMVGSCVLWGTPTVRMLGMGSAYAAPVSGDACRMTLEFVYCSRYAGSPIAYVTFRAHILPRVSVQSPPRVAVEGGATQSGWTMAEREQSWIRKVVGTGPQARTLERHL